MAGFPSRYFEKRISVLLGIVVHFSNQILVQNEGVLVRHILLLPDMRIWKKKSQEEIHQRVMNSLSENIDYNGDAALGVPASYLDDKVFNQDTNFLKEAPFMYAMVKNPNHIGCHTLGRSESFFKGSQSIEQELIRICAEDILQGDDEGQDGYLASGGTEANIQAIWIYRNLYLRNHGASRDEIGIICSEDSHYSMDKAADLLSISIAKVPVDSSTRAMTKEALEQTLGQEKEKGRKYFIVICNMITTMFGSVDDVEMMAEAMQSHGAPFHIHVDGAYGGFYHPFTEGEHKLSFANKAITSFTMDAHKMAQAPYGTGIFLIRKGFIQHANTREASYVEGEDYTLIGSRSGANAVAVWMILVKRGPFEWYERILILQKRTEWLCQALEDRGIGYFREASSNIVTISAQDISSETAKRFGLVPDDHNAPAWYKVIIMDHVHIEKLDKLIEAIDLASSK